MSSSLSYDPTLYRAHFECGEVNLTAAPVALGEGAFHFINVQNPKADFANVALNVPILVGSGARQRWRLLPGEETGWWPIENINQVFAKSADGTALAVSYVVVRLERRREKR